MYTIPTRLARPALAGGSPDATKKRAIQLYRDYCRGAPEIIRVYTLSCTPSEFRHAVRARFERNRYADPRTVDILLHKSRAEYQEMINFWKQRDHVLNWLTRSFTDQKTEKTFMQQFLEGRDGLARVPPPTVQ
ncbi:NdufA6 NADH-ubiquinone oxidoreductase 14.8 kDa subunit [Flagelloscypha sp. PMI_526]|nr:NdufA6 NADH-ubiquinone oxidoreductase 14.8 kDa subunit [Flagelloscypha sp. PMI_526]